MSHLLPFQIENFKNFCDGLERVGIDPGYVLYTNQYAGNNLPAARLVSGEQVSLARDYIQAPNEELFKRLVASGVMFDTEWDFATRNWQIISFEGWEVLHLAFSHLHAKSSSMLTDLIGVSDFQSLD